MAQIKAVLTNVNDAVAISMPDEEQAVGTVQITASADASTFAVEGTMDGATFVAIQVFPSVGGAGVTSFTGVGMWTFTVNGLKQLRVRKTVLGIGGAQTVFIGVVYV